MYVGQTGDTFYQRMLLNFSMIRTRKHDNVAEHFYSENHSVNDFMVIGIEKVFGEDTYRTYIYWCIDGKYTIYVSRLRNKGKNEL